MECLRSDASGVVVLKHVPYRIDGDDRLGRAYPVTKGAAALPRAVRAALFHRDHVEIVMCGARYTIFQLLASPKPTLKNSENTVMPLCFACWSPAMHLVKLLPTILLNSCVEHATQVLEHHGFNPGPELVALMRRVAAAKPGFVSACEAALSPFFGFGLPILCMPQ